MHERFSPSKANEEDRPQDVLHDGSDEDETSSHETLAKDDEPDKSAYEATQTDKTIWTPAFILTFFLLLTLGLSAESLLTQLWANRGQVGPWVIEAHVLLAASGWISLALVTRSRWTRLGCIFGCVWTLFMTLNVILGAHGLDFTTPIQTYINVAISVALLGASIGLSIEDPPLTAWDQWLFLLIPVLSACGITLTYFLIPQASILTSENALATAVTLASCFFWWLRPSCWSSRPGATFLFGLVPAILLVSALINGSVSSFFLLQIIDPSPQIRSYGGSFFFIQIALFALFLGCLLLTKREQSLFNSLFTRFAKSRRH